MIEKIVENISEEKEKRKSSHLTPRSIRLSDDVWQALRDMCVFNNKFISMDCLFNIILDMIWFEKMKDRTVDLKNFRYGHWKKFKEIHDIFTAGKVQEEILNHADKKGKIESHIAMEIVEKYNSNPLNPPYKNF